MCFSLGDIAVLDPEQRIIDEATFDENWLVYGPAGTGKTILALKRVERMNRMLPNETTLFVSRSKVLAQWVRSAAVEIGIGASIKTYDQFFWWFVKDRIKGDSEIDRDPPTLDDGAFDWDQIVPLLEVAYTAKPDWAKINLVLDEAQDLPLGFFDACKWMCNRVFILMDENQKTDFWDDSKRSEIAQRLGIDPVHQRLLKVNHRNPLEIKSLSETFFDGDVGELAEIPKDPKDRLKLEAAPLIRWLPLNDENARRDQIDQIISYCHDQPTATVCVVSPGKNDIRDLRDRIEEYAGHDIRLQAKPDWTVRSYVAKMSVPANLDMCAPGVIVSNSINFKGSEFRAVFLIDWDKSSETSASMYTTITRAKGRIEVLAENSEISKGKIRGIFEKALNEQLITEVEAG
jgi:hypothetical protein